MIAYLVRGSRQPFAAYPVQLKAAQRFNFGFSRKYDKFHDLLFAFVWYLDDPNQITEPLDSAKTLLRLHKQSLIGLASPADRE